MNSAKLQVQNDTSTHALLRALTLLYSLACYMIGVVALVCLILFIADLVVPVTLERGAGIAPNLCTVGTLLWNVGVVMVWGLQHSLMARPTFKRVWTKIVPMPIERSTYLVSVAMATVQLILLWTPMPYVIWDTSNTVLYPILTGMYFLGWCIVLFSAFLINHFHLFGLQQAHHFLRRHQSKKETFRTLLLYKLVRHPMMSGVLIALWATPVLTAGRLFFNVLRTTYVFVGLYFEERTLTSELGYEYEQYLQSTPAVVPRLRRKQSPDYERQT